MGTLKNLIALGLAPESMGLWHYKPTKHYRNYVAPRPPEKIYRQIFDFSIPYDSYKITVSENEKVVLNESLRISTGNTIKAAAQSVDWVNGQCGLEPFENGSAIHFISKYNDFYCDYIGKDIVNTDDSSNIIKLCQPHLVTVFGTVPQTIYYRFIL